MPGSRFNIEPVYSQRIFLNARTTVRFLIETKGKFSKNYSIRTLPDDDALVQHARIMNDVEDYDIIVATHDDNDEDESTYRHVKKKNKAINIGESVLGTCPVCGCVNIHRVLLQEHVEFCLTGKHRVRDEKENAKTLRDRTNYYEPHREEENEKRKKKKKKKKKKKPNAQFSILKFLQKKKQREEEEEKKSDETETTTTRTNDNNTNNNNNNSNNNNNNASIDDAEMNEEEEEEEVDLIAINTQIEGGKIPDKVSFLLNTMSGNYSECGICLEPFDEEKNVVRYLFYPCMHARQCKECAIRVWQTKKIRGKYKTNRISQCCWCSQKIEVRPRPFRPFL